MKARPSAIATPLEALSPEMPTVENVVTIEKKEQAEDRPSLSELLGCHTKRLPLDSDELES